MLTVKANTSKRRNGYSFDSTSHLRELRIGTHRISARLPGSIRTPAGVTDPSWSYSYAAGALDRRYAVPLDVCIAVSGFDAGGHADYEVTS